MRSFSIDETKIRVSRGERFEFTAPAVPTAGYRWSIQCDRSAVTEVEQSFEVASGRIGGGTVQHLVLEAAERGMTTVRLRYQQAGTPAAEDEREIEVRID